MGSPASCLTALPRKAAFRRTPARAPPVRPPYASLQSFVGHSLECASGPPRQGMRGSPTDTDKDRGSRRGEAGKMWKLWERLRAAFERSDAREAADALAWLVLGVVFSCVAPEALADFRGRLSRSWYALVGELERPAKEKLLDALPVVLVQAVFRLVVDAFPPEQQKLVEHSETVLEKMMHIVYHEVFGFAISPVTMRRLRRDYLQQHVVDNPHVDQQEAMRSKLREEALSRRQRALAFGSQKAAPLDETQLQHVLDGREVALARLKETTARRRTSTLQRIDEDLKMAPDELSVDRYADILKKSEEMFEGHMKQLHVHAPTVTSTAPSAPTDEPPMVKAGLDVTLDPSSLSRRASASSLFNASQAASEKLSREQALKERKRRQEQFEALLIAPLPAELRQSRLDTNLTSPMFDRITPAQGIPKPERKSLTLPMRPAKEELLPPLQTGRASPSPSPSSARRRKKKQKPVASLLGAISLVKIGKQMARQVKENRFDANGWRAHGLGTHVLPQHDMRVKPEVVMARVRTEAEATRVQSFEVYRKTHELETGVLKPVRTHVGDQSAEELSFVRELEGLVGSKSTPALRQLRHPLKEPGRAAARAPPLKREVRSFEKLPRMAQAQLSPDDMNKTFLSQATY